MNEAKPTTVLIVEDEPKISSLLADYLLAQGGYQSRVVDRGDQVLANFRVDPPDLVLLDLMLPGMDGIEVCKKLRSESDVPIIIVTARVEEIDRLLGLELGADDYICKPFSPREVVARVKAVLRRTSRINSVGKEENRTLEIDVERHTVTLDGRALTLTPVEFSLLDTLYSSPGRVFSRQQLMDAMYPDYRIVTDRAVDTHVKNLRKKLDAASDGAMFIESVYGVGYRFVSA